jgi:predicted AlkP superfamily pyrophosphatase or phosphodiesterase
MSVLALSAAALLPASVAPAQTAAPAAAATQAAPATAAPAPAATRPTLIIAISVDQYSADLFAEYRQQYSGGLARLARGVVFPAGYQAHGATETCPGHSTILTGSYPARTGIIANNWFELGLSRDDKRVYCSEDPSVPGSSSSGGRYTTTTNSLLVPTLGDRMKAADPRSRVVSVAGKDRAAIMMGGHNTDEMWWLSPTGMSSIPGRQQSPLVRQISQTVAAAIAQPREGLEVPQQCAGHNYPVTLAPGQTVGTGRLARAGGNFRGFMASPEADGAVLAAGFALQQDMHLGQGPQTDLLILGLSATDYVGHTYGTEGVEMCLQMLALDRELGDFFTRMDATGIDYMVVLTADHGGHDTPERNRDNAIPAAQRDDPALSPDAISNRLKQELRLTGVTGPLLYGDGPFGDFYVTRALPEAQRRRVLDAAIRLISANPQVYRVYRATDIAATPLSTKSPELWTIEERLRASYNPQRSGDFLVVLKDRVTPIPETGMGYIATHGSVWDYDRRVPMLFWRRGIHPFEQPNAVRTVDILPTIASVIGLPMTAPEIDGRCLDLIAGEGTSCPVTPTP